MYFLRSRDQTELFRTTLFIFREEVRRSGCIPYQKRPGITRSCQSYHLDIAVAESEKGFISHKFVCRRWFPMKESSQHLQDGGSISGGIRGWRAQLLIRARVQ